MEEEIKIFVFLYRLWTFYSNHRSKVHKVESKDMTVEKKLKFFVFLYRDCDRTFYSNHRDKVYRIESKNRCRKET